MALGVPRAILQPGPSGDAGALPGGPTPPSWHGQDHLPRGAASGASRGDLAVLRGPVRSGQRCAAVRPEKRPRARRLRPPQRAHRGPTRHRPGCGTDPGGCTIPVYHCCMRCARARVAGPRGVGAALFCDGEAGIVQASPNLPGRRPHPQQPICRFVRVMLYFDRNEVDVAQLVRALDCGSSGCGFDSRHPPQSRCVRGPDLRSGPLVFPLPRHRGKPRIWREKV